jgi:hypothetical protein
MDEEELDRKRLEMSARIVDDTMKKDYSLREIMETEEFYEKLALSRDNKDMLCEKINNLMKIVHRFGKDIHPSDFSFFLDDDDQPYVQLYDDNGDAIASIYAEY